MDLTFLHRSISQNDIEDVTKCIKFIYNTYQLAEKYNVLAPFDFNKEGMLMKCKTVEMASILVNSPFFTQESWTYLFAHSEQLPDDVFIHFVEEGINRKYKLPNNIYPHHFAHSEKVLLLIFKLYPLYHPAIDFDDQTIGTCIAKNHLRVFSMYYKYHHDKFEFPLTSVQLKCKKVKETDLLFISDPCVRQIAKSQGWISSVLESLFASRIEHLTSILANLLPIPHTVVKHILMSYVDLHLEATQEKKEEEPVLLHMRDITHNEF